MAKQWQGMDLKGGGLQQVQLLYKARQRTLPRAYAAWILFAIGGHRFYLHEPRGGAAYLLASLIALTAHLAAGWPWLWAVPAAAAVADLFWIPGRVLRRNKQIRMEVMTQSASPGAPAGMAGGGSDAGPSAGQS
jgi:TM2 domain-containing membrane protein YozV